MSFLQNIPLIITLIFLGVIISYYTLIFLPNKKIKKETSFKSITIIIPAHNEESYIVECIDSVLNADFIGTKEIIVVNDGSVDNTKKIVLEYKKYGVILINTNHSGKSASINKALKIAKGDLVAIVDADSTIEKNALIEMTKTISGKNVAAATGIVKVKNRKKHILMWVHIEQIYNSLMRGLLSKINGNVTTPGPLSMYRKKELLSINGFSTEGFSEDVDVTIRLIRKGHNIGFSNNSVAYTYMPYDVKGFFRQRTRFARGMLNIFKRHINFKSAIIDIYTLPILVFTYIQAIIMGLFTIYQLISGYIIYFAAKGMYFNWYVVKFFFDWFSIIGFGRWFIGVFTGTTPLSAINIIGIASTLLSYPLYFIAIAKIDRKIDIWHIIPIIFMFPFWLLIMFIYIFMLPEIFRKKQKNIWKKNE